MKWEYFDRMIVFQDTEQGMVSGLETWINGAGAEPPPLGRSISFARTRVASG